MGHQERLAELTSRAESYKEHLRYLADQADEFQRSYYHRLIAETEVQLSQLRRGEVPVGMATNEDMRSGLVPGISVNRRAEFWDSLGKRTAVRFLIGAGAVLHLFGVPWILVSGNPSQAVRLLGAAWYLAGFWFWGWLVHKMGIVP